MLIMQALKSCGVEFLKDILISLAPVSSKFNKDRK